MEPDLKLILDGDDNNEDEDDDDHVKGTPNAIYVWRQVMANASPYFRAMLSPDRFAEGTPSGSQGLRAITLPETNAKAMRIICDIFHLRSRNVPVDDLSSNDLVHIAILVDRFDCSEAMRPWSQKWMEQSNLASEMNAVDDMSIDTLSKWACICHVFGFSDRAQRYLHQLTLYATGDDFAHGGPRYLEYIPQAISDAEEKRSTIASKLQQLTVELIQQLQQGQSCQVPIQPATISGRHYIYSSGPAEAFQCTSILLGNALLAVIHTIGKTWETEAWTGSIADMYEQMLEVAKKLNGPSHLAYSFDQDLVRPHAICSWTTKLVRQIEEIIAEVDPVGENGENGVLPREKAPIQRLQCLIDRLSHNGPR